MEFPHIYRFLCINAFFISLIYTGDINFSMTDIDKLPHEIIERNRLTKGLDQGLTPWLAQPGHH